MKEDIRTQYDHVAEVFSKNHTLHENSNDANRIHFYSFLGRVPRGGKLLDVASGDGFDVNEYQKMGFKAEGIDASKAMINIARKKHPGVEFKIGFAENMPYGDRYFDVVASKYAIMTSHEMEPIFKEIARVLKKGGYFVYLATHPFRHFFEKRSLSADYFEQKVVVSNILNNSVSLKEPSHTMKEYLSPVFLKYFDVIAYDEAFDPAAEKIGRKVYPGYMIILARKRG